MNKTQAKEIAYSGITAGQLKETLKAAYDAGEANASRSKVNKGMSRATCFNILAGGYKNLDDNKLIEGSECLSAKNILWEFGDYWEGSVPEKKSRNKGPVDYHHVEAIDCPF